MDTNNSDKSDNKDANQDINQDNKVNNNDENSLKEHLKLKNYDKRKISSAYALITQMAIQVIVIMGGTFFLGKWIDEKFGTSPLFLLLMLLLGMASAFKSIYDMGMNQVKKFEKHDKYYSSYKKQNYKDYDNNQDNKKDDKKDDNEDENSDF